MQTFEEYMLVNEGKLASLIGAGALAASTAFGANTPKLKKIEPLVPRTSQEAQAKPVADPVEEAGAKYDKNSIKESLKEHEGLRLEAYTDAGGKSIGYGFFLENSPSKKQIVKKVTGQSVATLYNGKSITAQQADKLLDYSIEIAIKDAESAFPGILELNGKTQEVLIEMAYIMGKNKLAGDDRWPKLKEGIEEKNYTKIADEILDSKFARKDAPKRANALAERVRDSIPSSGDKKQESPKGKAPALKPWTKWEPQTKK